MHYYEPAKIYSKKKSGGLLILTSNLPPSTNCQKEE